MLEARHITKLKLAPARLVAHKEMPPPACSTKALTSHFAAVGEAVIASLMNIDPTAFQMQLLAAREHGVSFLAEDAHRNTIGISASTSLIKSGDLLQKNLIIPRDFTQAKPQLDDHLVIGVFLRGHPEPGRLPTANEVEVAGWIDQPGVRKWGVRQLPPTFKSKLPVVMVPCRQLYPLPELLARFKKQTTVCV